MVFICITEKIIFDIVINKLLLILSCNIDYLLLFYSFIFYFNFFTKCFYLILNQSKVNFKFLCIIVIIR